MGFAWSCQTLPGSSPEKPEKDIQLMQGANSAPTISVVTPSFNAEKYIALTIDSILHQDFSDWELLIVDDSSTDNTPQIIQSYMARDERIRGHFNAGTNRGPAKARNQALKHARGKYVAFIDADDIWELNKLSTQLEYFKKHEEAQLVYSSFTYINPQGEPLGAPIPIPSQVSYHELLKHNCIPMLTVMIKKELLPAEPFEKVGHEDYALWLKLLKMGVSAQGINISLARYRVVSGSLSRNKFRNIKWTWHIYRELEKLNIIRSSYYLGNIAFLSVAKKMKSKMRRTCQKQL